MEPFISIVIPAYNAAPHIGEMIASVQAQTYSNWELLIVDDGSSDNTAGIARSFMQDKRIRCISQANSGVSAARNKGLQEAKGDLIGFLDADDAMAPENLATKAEMLARFPEADFVFSNVTACDEHLNPSWVIEGTDKDILTKLLLWEGAPIPLPAGNIIARKKCFESGLRFDTSFSTAADQDFAIYLAVRFKGKHIPLPCVYYRISPAGMSRNIALMEKDHTGVYRKAEQNKLFPSRVFKKQCFSNLYLILAGSWWVNGKNKRRGMYFILKSIACRPLQLFKILKKIV